jgi:hypothetical protein
VKDDAVCTTLESEIFSCSIGTTFIFLVRENSSVLKEARMEFGSSLLRGSISEQENELSQNWIPPSHKELTSVYVLLFLLAPSDSFY